VNAYLWVDNIPILNNTLFKLRFIGSTLNILLGLPIKALLTTPYKDNSVLQIEEQLGKTVKTVSFTP